MKNIVFNGGLEVNFLQEGKDTNYEISIFKCIMPSGVRTPMPHYHAGFDETVKGLKGVITWTVGEKTTDVGPGDSVFIPRGVIHSFANKTGETVEFVCEIRPGTFGAEYFEEIATVLNTKGIPDFKELKNIMRSHGLVPVLGLKRQLIFGILDIIRKLKG